MILLKWKSNVLFRLLHVPSFHPRERIFACDLTLHFSFEHPRHRHLKVYVKPHEPYPIVSI